MLSWSSFNVFESVINRYMPSRGEGDTMASQIVTAVNKLVYKWFNDGDVFDNTYMLEGWANDLSTYANWLYERIPEAKSILLEIGNCETEDDYVELLYNLASTLLDSEFLEQYNQTPTSGSIYDAYGPFKYEEPEYDYDEEDD